MLTNTDSTFVHSTGIIPSQTIREMLKTARIISDLDVTEKQIQPASIDLRLGEIAYRVQASFLPGQSSTVMEKLKTMEMHQIDLSNGAVLEKGCVYIVPLQESLRLNSSISGTANPKSSTGRLDVFTRLLTDYTSEFETVSGGYN